MADIVKCTRCGSITTNTRTKHCDTCKTKDLVKKWGCKDYKK